MKNNFQTLISAILTKASSLFVKKEDVYTKAETVSKEEVYTKDEAISKQDLAALTPADIAAAPAEHEHSYLHYREIQATLPSTDYWSDATYGDGKFVAVAFDSNKAAYSEDGINWIESTLPSTDYWNDATYGNDKFVISGSNKVAYSEDGINWIEPTLPSIEDLGAVAYGNDKFVVVAGDGMNSNKAIYSEDGINWTETTMPSISNWQSVAYGNDKFVAVAYKSNKAAYSEDGINWSETTLASKYSFCRLVYGNDKFVAVPYGSNKAIYSEDGISWNESTLPSTEYWQSITYGDGKFVAVAFDSNKAAYSEDGINWIESTLPLTEHWRSITYGNDKFVAVAYESNKAAYSEDGINWTDKAPTFTQNGIMITPNQLGLATEGYVDGNIEAALNSIEIPTSVSQLTNDAGFITAEDIPGGGGSGSPAIIDVPELPTENINKQAFYRLMTAQFVQYGTIEGWKCYIVDNLPEIGEPVSTDMQNITAYYNKQDGNVYGYADSMISQVGGVPVGWYTMDVLAQAFDVSWGGVTSNEDEIDGNNIKVFLMYDYYMYQDDWRKVPFAYEKAPKYNITWDGDMTDRLVLDMSSLGYENTYFVKVSDEVFTTYEMVGWWWRREVYERGDFYYENEIGSDSFHTETYPGAFTINNFIVVLHDADTLATALGIPAGIYTNGIYFWLQTDVGHVSSLTSPPRISKIDSRYIDTEGFATEAYVESLIYGAIGGSY